MIEDAAVRVVRGIAEGLRGAARDAERERLEMLLGGPATVERMMAHLSQLLDAADDAVPAAGRPRATGGYVDARRPTRTPTR
ncbi:hypothetical protein [Amycolatopsis sp. lyj-23]|uniref:hypothetical protein n=1 Tax=Amycolatopsis sp. lyj-23 TaxID=2789283 RepID=UPI00397CB054